MTNILQLEEEIKNIRIQYAKEWCKVNNAYNSMKLSDEDYLAIYEIIKIKAEFKNSRKGVK